MKHRHEQYQKALRNQNKNFLYEIHVSVKGGQKLNTKKILYGSEEKMSPEEIHMLVRQNLANYYGIQNATIRITKRYRLSKERIKMKPRMI